MAGVEFPDLLWQHQYGQNWAFYSSKENELINKASRKWQKTVTLPNSDKKKHIVVYLEKMYQENKVSSRRQNIRCLIYNNGFYSWLWYDEEEEEWISFKPRLVCFLEIALKRDAKVIKFFENGDYKINLGTFQQTNEKTNSVTAIKREKVQKEKATSRQDKMNQTFQQFCSDINISFDKRLMNLPSMSANSSALLLTSCGSELLDVSNCSFTNESDYEAEMLDDENLCADSQCHEAKNFHIYRKEDTIYAATLNFVNIASNTNKFCILQVLEHNSRKQFALWCRYGRLGSKGLTELNKYGNVELAKEEFEDKFYEKTKNDWSDRINFRYIPGKYDVLNIDLTSETEPVSFPEPANMSPNLESLLDLICDENVVIKMMEETFYNYENAPLGRLMFKQIKDGYKALTQIAEVLTQDDAGTELISACEAFYTKIPHNFGKKYPPIIQTQEDLKTKLDLLELLWNLRKARKALDMGHMSVAHPFNRYLESFKCSLVLLETESAEFMALSECLHGTHCPTHNRYVMEILDAYRCEEKQDSFCKSSKTILLWHGSRLTNWIGILSSGLHIAPKEAPSSGWMFGKGLYFADTSSKSANYCFATKKDNQGLLLMCEVAVGNPLILEDGNVVLPDNLPPMCNSVFGKGRMSPTFRSTVLSSEAMAPFPPLVDDSAYKGPLQYNEYVVYSPEVVRMKYLLRIKFHFR